MELSIEKVVIIVRVGFTSFNKNLINLIEIKNNETKS
jgi:hypothetical protein